MTGGLVLTWTAPDGGELSDANVDDLERSLLDGLGAASDRLGERPSRVVNQVIAGPGPIPHAFAHAVAGWGRGLARELARVDTTVNTVITGNDDPDSRALVAFLASGDAGFITGQTLGLTTAAGPGPERRDQAQRPEQPLVVVSGGAGDLGRAICGRLAGDGWRVVIGHRTGTDGRAVARDLDPSGEVVTAEPLDLLDPESIADAGGHLAERYGRIDGVVLNAGWTPTAAFADMDGPSRLRVIQTNLTGPARLLVALRPVLAPGAVVVGTGSEAGRVGEANRAVYSGAKAGLGGLLAALDRTIGRTVMTAPGPYDTALLRQTWGDPDRAERGIERLRQLVPLRRLGQPAELAAAVAFALSPAGGALGGQTLSVGGGITMV